ncbi:preprotein translocase, SecG subunit [Thiocapsa marina 5811]|uniref:Protein-export membrane protein SecG n=1 Tax=Thiocapsa marina 5811 TaxID=768671 RepID=F9U553_9GAMM|nr:preprotein translocase, SecG subunit [Thiocapsa marina 5811]
MQTILTVMQVFLSLGLIGLILIQHGKGADAGAAFGSGASATVFGARGSGSFLTRTTGIMATMFFLTSMALAYYATKGSEPVTIMDRVDERTIIVPPPAAEPVSDIPAIPGGGGGQGGDSGTDVPAVAVPANGDLSGGDPIGGDFSGNAQSEIVETVVIEGSGDKAVVVDDAEVTLDESAVQGQNEGVGADTATQE